MSELADIMRSMEKKLGMRSGHRASIHDISAFNNGFQQGQRRWIRLKLEFSSQTEPGVPRRANVGYNQRQRIHAPG
jgi:hypothetical protein